MNWLETSKTESQVKSKFENVILHTFTVESDMPIPAKIGGGFSTYPLKTMKIGDSFFIPCENIITMQRRVTSAAKRAAVKISVRKVIGGVRVWRIGANG